MMEPKTHSTLLFLLAHRCAEQHGFTLGQIVQDLKTHCDTHNCQMPSVEAIFTAIAEADTYDVCNHYWRQKDV